jgi:exodeoxyribonuclease V beta subunit
VLAGVNRKVFDINSPLPFQKRVLLEASAGTGKTFNLTSLVARYVAEEDLKIDQLLMVTFTNAAASEMRERTRAKLSDALAALESDISPDLVKQEDIWMKNIVDCTGDIREERKSRLRDAISTVDSATIATIHGFFQQALREVGLRSADSASSEVAQGKDSLGRQILRDELVTMFSAGEVNLMAALPDKTPNDLEKAILEIIKGLNSNISATAAPDGSEDPVANEWSAFVNQIRQKINEQRISSGTLSFDDLITGLRDLLKPENPLSKDVIEGMRARYRLVLIDEFQDTDDTQWDIFSNIFDVEYMKSVQGTVRSNETFLAMIMVGDPKQAIYRFRGADIAAYLKAVEDSNLERFEMKRNFRSDRNLIMGLNRWFQGKIDTDGEYTGFKFGNKNIAFIQVEAAKKGAGSGLTISGHENESKALQFRWISTDQKPAPTVKILRPRIAEDLCNHVTLLLNKGTIPDKRDGAVVERRVQPGDISILVRTHVDAEPIVEALRARGIPVVKSNVGSVSQSEAVIQLRTLLSAMASPNDSRRVKALALTWFVGYSFKDLLDDKKIVDLGLRCNEWAKQLLDLGIVGFYQTLRAEESAVASISLSIEAERRLTDLEHLAELLHSRTSGKKLSAASILRYLDELAGEDDESDELLRRIDSDAKAIQITTMHASKGLEYPIVLIPFPKAPNTKGAQVFTYENRRLVNAAPNSSWFVGDLNEETRKAITQEEIEGDDLRLMYVAFTRAKHQLVVWWANSKGMATSPLSRLLFGNHDDITEKTKIKDGADARNAFTNMQNQIGLDDNDQELMHVTELAIDDASIVPLDSPDLADHSIGQSSEFPAQAVRNWNWRRWSFSSLSSSLKNEESDSHRGGFDEGESTTESESSIPTSGLNYSGPGLFEMPASAEFGTLVHEILEKVNFTSSTLKEDLIETISAYGSETLRGIDVDNLAQGLLDSLCTHLDPLVPGFQLVDLDSRDRLAEMDFHFTLARPDVSAEQIALAAASDNDSMFAEYFIQLAQKWRADGGRNIAGLMTGSIDLLFRVRSGDRHKYFVVDYKSNRLHTPSEVVSHASYGVNSMKKAMEEHHYPLQALFYCVALHRFLSMRVSDYDIDRDLGGAGYLFVRGMVGHETPIVNGTHNGVLAWRPSTQTILTINALLGGEAQ